MLLSFRLNKHQKHNGYFNANRLIKLCNGTKFKKRADCCALFCFDIYISISYLFFCVDHLLIFF